MKSSIKILQLKETKETRNYSFASLKLLESMGLKVSLDNYRVVYEFEDEIAPNAVYEELERMYMRFQGVKPDCYTGHSLSISDIVQIDGTNYYVDDYGFQKV